MVIEFSILFLNFLAFYTLIYFLGRSVSFSYIISNKEATESKALKVGAKEVGLELFYPIIGLFILGNLAVLLNFFIPLKNTIFISIILFIILVFNFKNKFDIIELKNLSLSLLVYPFLLISTFSASFSYDAGLYHLNNQLWLRESNIIFGFSNIYGPFGVSSIYEYLSALLWIDGSFIFLHLLNIIFIGVFFNFLINCFNTNNESFLKKSSVLVLMYSVLDNFGYEGGRNGFLYIQSVGNLDVAVAVVLYINSMLIINSILNKDLNPNDLKIFSILSLFIIQMKISSFPIVIIFLIYLFKYFKYFGFKSLFKQIFFPIFLFLFWIIKSLIQTGCIIFPFSPLCFKSLSWVDYNYLKATEEVSISFSTSYVFGSNFSVWLDNYFEIPINKTVFINFLLSIGFIILLNIFNFKLPKNNESNYILLIYLVFSLLFYLIFGPDVRYLIGLQIFIIGNLAIFIKKPTFSNKIIIAMLFLISVISIARLQSYNPESYNDFPYIELPEYSNTKLFDRNYPSEGDQCWIDIECSANKLDYNIEQRKYFKFVTINYNEV